MNDDENQCDAPVSQKAESPKRVQISLHDLRKAHLLAERKVEEGADAIRQLEQQRDAAARDVGMLQDKLDNLRRHHRADTAHLRTLEALLP